MTELRTMAGLKPRVLIQLNEQGQLKSLHDIKILGDAIVCVSTGPTEDDGVHFAWGVLHSDETTTTTLDPFGPWA